MKTTWKHLKALIMGPDFETRDLWDRLIAEILTKAQYIIRTVTGLPPLRLLSALSINSLNVSGITPVKHKAPKLWGQFVPAVASDTTNYPMRVENLFDKVTMGETRDVSLAGTHGVDKIWYAGSGSTSFAIPIEPNTTYTVYCTESVRGTIFRAAITERLLTPSDDASNPYTPTAIVRNTTNVPITITSDANDAYLYVQYSSTVFEECKDACVIVKGSTAPTEYVPYGSWMFVKDIGADGTGTDFGYYNEETGEFVKAAGASGTVIQPVKYLTFDGSSYFDLAPLTTAEDIEVRFRKGASDTNFLFGTNPNSSTSTAVGAWVGSGGLNIQNGLVRSITSIDTGWHTFRVTSEKTYVDGVERASAGTRSMFQDLVVGSARNELTEAIDNRGFKGDMSGFTVGTHEFIAVRVDATAYLLDTEAWTLYANAGTGAVTYGSDIPYAQLCPDIIKVNTGDVLYGVNTLNDANIATGYSANGNYTYKGYFGATADSVHIYTANTKYRVSKVNLKAGTYTWWTDTPNCHTLRYSINGVISSFGADTDHFTFTLTTEDAEFQMCWRNTTTTDFSGEHTMIVAGSTVPTQYVPYNGGIGIHTDGEHKLFIEDEDGNIIERDIPMLLSEGSYVNVQTGGVSEAWAVVVLDGTNVGVLNNKQGNIWIINVSGKASRKTEIVCSHFAYSTGTSSTAPDHTCISFASYQFGFRADEFITAAEVNAWLASEYAKGTPVIFLYPLATPAQSTVSIAPINIPAEGDYTAITDPATKMEITYLSTDVSASNGVMTVRRIRPTATIEGGVMTL